MTKTISPSSLKKFISPTLDFKVAEKKTFFGRNFQQVRNVGSMSMVKIIRTYGLLCGQGWNNNKKLTQKITPLLEKYTQLNSEILNHILQSKRLKLVSISQNTISKINDETSKVFTDEEFKNENKDLLGFISLLHRVKIDKNLSECLDDPISLNLDKTMICEDPATESTLIYLETHLAATQELTKPLHKMDALEIEVDDFLKELSNFEVVIEKNLFPLDPRECVKVKKKWLALNDKIINLEKEVNFSKSFNYKFDLCLRKVHSVDDYKLRKFHHTKNQTTLTLNEFTKVFMVYMKTSKMSLRKVFISEVILSATRRGHQEKFG